MNHIRDVLKIAAGVCLGLAIYSLISLTIFALSSASTEERAARELLDRQFAPAN